MNCRLPIADCRLPESKGRRQFLSIANRKSQIANGFTLVELLMVLAIMGILAALAVPALKNFGHANAMTAADQQMKGAVAHARQLAISRRTTVYMVFVPADFWAGLNLNDPNLTSVQKAAITNLCGAQLTGYTFMSYGELGDQPGQHQWHYLEPWQTLPEGTFIATNKFLAPDQSFDIPAWDRDYHNAPVPIYGFATNAFPVPTEDSPQFVMLPCLAFNYRGELTTNGVGKAQFNEYIPLARGVAAPAVTADGKTFVLAPMQVMERPPGNSSNAYNIINLAPLAGQGGAVLETPKVQ